MRPDLSGVAVAARRVVLSSPPEAAIENIREAMELWLEIALELGDTIAPTDAATGAVAA